MEKFLDKKKKFENPMLEVVMFDSNDIIVTSGGDFGEGPGQQGDDFPKGWW